MSCRVVWRRRVRLKLDVLAFLAHEGGDFSGGIPKAVDEVELRLALAPDSEGESRADDERVLIVHPLTVVYEVFKEPQVVLIYAAVYYPRMRA